MVVGGVERLFDTERLILWIRFATIPFALIQIFTYYLQYPRGIFSAAVVTVAILALGNAIIWYFHRNFKSEKQIVYLSYAAMMFDTLIVCLFVSLFTFDANTAAFILIYILPLEAAARFGRRGAFWVMGAVTILYALRELIGAHYYGYDFLMASISFRMGMGFVIAAIAGTLAASWLRERQRVAELYEQEKMAKNTLRDMDNLKNNFLSAVAHELRTPLTSIMGFSMTLQNKAENLNEKTKKLMLDNIVNESARMHALLEDLLDVNKLSQGLVDIKRVKVDLEKTFAEVAGRVQATTGRAVQLISSETNAHVDQVHIERILENLLLNATKYTPEDSPIKVTIEAHHQGILISVADKGPGVFDEYKISIFEPFQRGAERVSHKPGTGVGLSLVMQLAQLHGGRAWVEDNKDSGAIFRVYLKSIAST